MSLVVAAMLAVGAQPASATIVYEHGKEVWAMNDDGSDQRLLASGGPLGMEAGIGDPHVAPNGSTVVFEGSTNRNYHTCGGTLHWGQHAAGIYRWRDGAVARLSQDPLGQPTCLTTFHSAPEATTNGRVLNTLLINANGTFGQGFQSGTQEGPADASNPSGCDNDVDLADPSPNPANPAQFAHLGCESGGGTDAVSVTTGGTHTTPIVDDAPQRAVGWRSDGGRLVVSEGGTEAGIWTYNPASPVDPSHVLAGDFADVNFAGGGNERILFASGGDIWSVSSSCTVNTCTMAQATRLTTSGSNDHPSWTSSGLRPPAAPTGTTPNPGGGAGTTNPGSGSGGGGGGQTPVTASNVFVDFDLVGRPTSRRGFAIAVYLRAPATVEFTFSQKKGRKWKKLGTVRKSGKAEENVFKIPKVGRKKFKKGSYRADIRAVLNGAKGPSKRVGFSVKK